jgi:hypothetical protein
VVSSSQHLLQSIEGLVEKAHRLRVGGVNETGGLEVVDRLDECVMEEGSLDVELVHGPTPGNRQSQHSPNGGRLDDGVEGLVIVHPTALGETLENQRSVVLV